MFNQNFEIRERCKGAVQRSALCRSRRELSNEYLLAKVGFDTAENKPKKVRKFELSEMLNLNFEISKLLFTAQYDAPRSMTRSRQASNDAFDGGSVE